MSPIDKQARVAQLETELQARIAEQAYKSFNGTRQSVRNFREGTLNIGKMNFDNTAQDRITKEMVTDFHKKEQQRLDEQLQGKTETGLISTIETELVSPRAIRYPRTRAPVTSTDLENKQTELTTLVNQITRYENNIKVLPIRNKEIDKLVQNPSLPRPEYIELSREKLDNIADIKTAKRNLPKAQRKLPNLQTEYELMLQNMKDNEQEIINANITNKAVAKKYEDAFNVLNQNLYSVKQEPHESELDYIRRIQQLDTMKYDPKLFKDKADTENSKELMKNLKQVISEDVKISEIVKALNPDEIFDVNKYWAKIKDTIIKVFGVNNKQATVKTYLEFIMAILDTIDTKGSIATVFPTTGGTPVPPTAATSVPIPSVPKDYEYEYIKDTVGAENVLRISNPTSTIKEIFIRIGKSNLRGEEHNQVVFSRTTNEKTKFRRFTFVNNSPNYDFKTIMTDLGLLPMNDDFRLLFGRNINKDAIFDHLNKKLSLTTGIEQKHSNADTVGSIFSRSIMGWGMKNEEIPKHAHFGKNIILLDKLFYKNILSIKDKKMHSVEHFPNVKVSDTLTDIIYNMCTKNTKPTKEMLNSLKTTERKLFDLLLYVSGLGKNMGVTTAKEEYVKELKDRLQLVESQIRAGNNNPVVKTELKEIIQKLYLYNAISMNNGKAYLKQF